MVYLLCAMKGISSGWPFYFYITCMLAKVGGLSYAWEEFVKRPMSNSSLYLNKLYQTIWVGIPRNLAGVSTLVCHLAWTTDCNRDAWSIAATKIKPAREIEYAGSFWSNFPRHTKSITYKQVCASWALPKRHSGSWKSSQQSTAFKIYSPDNNVSSIVELLFIFSASSVDCTLEL
jgi:hypothetical protein